MCTDRPRQVLFMDEHRLSLDASLTLDDWILRSQWRWEDYTPLQLWRSSRDWLKMTSDPVYLESPLLGRGVRSYCLLGLLGLMVCTAVQVPLWDDALTFGRTAYGLACIALCVVFHHLRRPMLSDSMLCASVASGVVFEMQVLGSLILCESHPLQVSVAALFYFMRDELEDSCTPMRGLYCPDVWVGRGLRCAWFFLVAAAHCFDYTARVRFIVDGAETDWEASWDLCSWTAQEERRALLPEQMWRWLKLSTQFLASPIAGRTCRFSSIVMTVVPFWGLWILCRCQTFALEETLPGGTARHSAVQALLVDVAAAVACVLVPAAAVGALWYRQLISDPIASDLLLALAVVVAWALVLFQCLPIPLTLPDYEAAHARVVEHVLTAKDMTVIGLATSGIHPGINCLIYTICLILVLYCPSLRVLAEHERTQGLVMLLFCCTQVGSYWWRLVIMNRVQSNAWASNEIHSRTVSKGSNISAGRPKLEAFREASMVEMELLPDSPAAGSAGALWSSGRTGRRRSSSNIHCEQIPRASVTSTTSRREWHPTIAVVRHGERADHCFESDWPSSQDAKKYPFDPPITEKGTEQAYEVAEKLRTAGEFHVVVSSPYLRCVQTGLAIAERLNCALLLDADAGEVFGPKVFGDVACFDPRSSKDSKAPRPWRSLRALKKAVYSKDGATSLADMRVFWGRTLGKSPEWPEGLHQARLRYTRCFLKYMRRAWKTKRNFVVVTHEYMVQACLRVLPASCFLEVDRIQYCCGLAAWLHRSAPACLFTADAHSQEEDSDEEGRAASARRCKKSLSDGGKTEKSLGSIATAGVEDGFYEAGVQWWEVALLGVGGEGVVEDLKKRNAFQVVQSKCLQELGPCWQDVKQMLGGLPEMATKEKEQHPEFSTRHRVSLCSSTCSEARTICSSEASTNIFSKLGREDYKQTLVKTEAGERHTDRRVSNASTCFNFHIAAPPRPLGKTPSGTLDSSLPISPALKQLRIDGAGKPLRRVSDAAPEGAAAVESLVREFKMTSALARRRATKDRPIL